MRKIQLKKQKRKASKRLLLLTLILTAIGLVAVADASAPTALNTFSDKYYFVKQQLLWGGVGVVALIVFSLINYNFWKKISVVFFAISLIFLILVLIPSLGTQALGARRWLVLGPISFQPAEIVKLSLAVFIASIASSDKKTIAYFIPVGLVSFLIMLQPDLGTTIVIATIALTQIFVAGVNILHFLGALTVGSVVSLILILTSGYRRERLLTFLQMTKDPLGKAYHIRQVLYSLGTGGLFGVGLGQSRQKYLFLPEAATDSIFAVIAEELGFLGATVIILLFGTFIYFGLKIARNAPDKFSQVLAIGIVTWIGGQAFVNIGSMLALVPLTGIPLPFVSYGGSSLTMVLIATGILLNISRYEHKKK